MSQPQAQAERTEQRSDHSKRIATAKARAALCGATLIAMDTECVNPTYVVTRWAYTRCFSSMDAVEALLNRMEGRKS